MSKLHIGKDGTPRKCVAPEGKCSLAHPMAHFAQGDITRAQEFADEYNKVKLELSNGTGMGKLSGNEDPDKVIAYHVAVSDHCKEVIDEKFGSGTTKDSFKNPIKWQKQQRNKYLKEMKNLDARQKEILEDLSNRQVEIKTLQSNILSEKDPDKRKEMKSELKGKRKEFSSLMKEYSKETVENELLYNKALNKKREHEDKLINHIKNQNEFEAISNTYYESEESLKNIRQNLNNKETNSSTNFNKPADVINFMKTKESLSMKEAASILKNTNLTGEDKNLVEGTVISKRAFENQGFEVNFKSFEVTNKYDDATEYTAKSTFDDGEEHKLIITRDNYTGTWTLDCSGDDITVEEFNEAGFNGLVKTAQDW